MTLSTYIKKLQAIAKDYPDAKVIFAADQEGNSFYPLHFPPSTGNFDGSNFDNSEKAEVNAVCVN